MRAHALRSLIGLLCLTAQAAGHGGAPAVKAINFPPQGEGQPWLVDEVGLLVEQAPGYVWLCDESVSSLVGFDAVAPVDAEMQSWAVGTRAGVFRTEDGGCSFAQVAGALTEHVAAGLFPHPERPGELLTATATLGIPNDVFRSTDGGRTWIAAGLESGGRVRSVLRAPADPMVVFASHGEGASRSDDGGASFTPITLGPAAEDLPDNTEILPVEFEFLAGNPQDANDLFAAIARFPDSFVVRSNDGGDTWRVVHVFEDTPNSMVVSTDGQSMLMSSPFVGLVRSTDGGETWGPVPAPGMMSCLTVEPATDRVWACGRGQPTPWVVAASDDFGTTWIPELADYVDIAATWACPDDAPTTRACDGRCQPGGGIECFGDGGVTDAATDAAIADGGVDAAPTPDATTTGTSGGDDCSATPGAPGGGWGLLLVLAWARRRF